MVFLVFWDSIPKRCKGVHCVDLGESFPTSIYLQNLASIQPRTSPSRFGGKFNSLFNRLLGRDLDGDGDVGTSMNIAAAMQKRR